MNYTATALLFTGILFSAAPSSARATLHFNAGNSHVFEATGFAPSGFDASKVGLQGFFTELFFGPDIITDSDRIHAEYYEDVLGGAWWMKSSIGVLPGETRSSTGDGVYGPMATFKPFDDFQGVVYLWMEAGSVDVQKVRLTLARDGQLYQQTFILPVPEPTSAVLFFCGLGIASLARRRRR